MKAFTVLAIAVTVTVSNWGNTRITDTAIIIGSISAVHLFARITRHN